MNQPWYWYVEPRQWDGSALAVRINTAPAFSVRGTYWVITFRTGDNEFPWRVYLTPKSKYDFNGEWVFHHREQWVPPLFSDRVVEYCPHCGQEMEV